MTTNKSILITGVTGTLGKEFIKELLATSTDTLYVLVRRKGRFTHWDRMRKILAGSDMERFLGTRIHAVEGDVTLPSFGIPQHDLLHLRKEVTEFFHIAALTALNGTQEQCEAINVGGTRHALKLANEFREQGKLQRFFYFSTAYVAGSKQTYCSKEDELPAKPAHANFYESSKFQSESLVREAMAAGLPVTIFRPSIVVGDSKTGAVSEFNVIYPFMKMFAHGILTVLPTRLDNSFNIVPIDFVIKAASFISRKPDSIGKTYHLITQNPPSIGMLLRMKQEDYPQLPPIKVVDPETFNLESLDLMSRSVYQMLEPYLGYLNDNLTFDASNTVAALEGSKISMPKTDYEFLRLLIRYAVSSGYLMIGDRPVTSGQTLS